LGYNLILVADKVNL